MEKQMPRFPKLKMKINKNPVLALKLGLILHAYAKYMAWNVFQGAVNTFKRGDPNKMGGGAQMAS